MDQLPGIQLENPLLRKEEIDINDGDPATDRMLAQMQANILKYHGRQYSWQVFLTFLSGQEEAAANWIRSYAARITSAKTQLKDAEHRRADPRYDGGVLTCFFLSRQGYQYLGYDMAKNDQPEHNRWFGATLQSMKEPQLAARLGDPKMETWDNMYRQDIHVMVLLADSGKDRLLQELQTILAQTEKFIVKKTADHLPIKKADDILFVQKGEALRNRDGFSIEHFGYVDGISQPRFLKGETEPGKRWNDIIWRKAVLVEDKVPGYQNCFGSFLVFRKLEQNVQRFRQAIDELAALLSPGEVNEEAKKLAGAYVVGRFSNGTPVVKHPAEIPVRPGEEVDNDFDYKYDATATKCPFHAHTRVVCPRDIDPAQWLRRIVRRGIPYDEAGRNNDMAWFPSQDVGLLFMCYQANIFLQFETLQATWANDGKVGEFKKVGIDSIAGQGAMNAQPQQWPAKWDKDDKLNGFSFPSTVTLKGGEYFFAPSIPFLRHLPPF